MRIGILGTGTMGMSLGRLFARGGHDVVFGSRSIDRARVAAGSIRRAVGSSYQGAVAGSDVVALAAVWSDVPSVLESVGNWSDRILLDCTNPEPFEGRGLVLGHSTSGAEEIARAAPAACVVKALNHLYAEALDGAGPGRPRPVAFHCGDDAGSKEVVAALLESAGLRAVDAGPLRSARYLEPLAALMVELVRGLGHDPGAVAGLIRAGA